MPAKDTTTANTKKPSSIKQYYYGTGRRKNAVAQVRIYKDGKGEFTVNDRELTQYFPLTEMSEIINSAFKITSTSKKFDICVKVNGGGIMGQAQAIRHGISRALLEYNEAFRITLKKAGFLTRDARRKERKKPGLKRARRAPQFSKR